MYTYILHTYIQYAHIPSTDIWYTYIVYTHNILYTHITCTVHDYIMCGFCREKHGQDTAEDIICIVGGDSFAVV